MELALKINITNLDIIKTIAFKNTNTIAEVKNIVINKLENFPKNESIKIKNDKNLNS